MIWIREIEIDVASNRYAGLRDNNCSDRSIDQTTTRAQAAIKSACEQNSLLERGGKLTG